MLSKKLVAFLALLLLAGVVANADVCTAVFLLGSNLSVENAVIDYGNGKTEKPAAKSATDIIAYLESSGWKLVQMAAYSTRSFFMVFEK